MRDAGLAVREDEVGNVLGRRGEGPALLLGSHLDTVRDAGRYDGPLGVLVAIAVRRAPARARRCRSRSRCVGFADEEGVRYGTAYLGTSALAGTLRPAELERVDADGDRDGRGDPRLRRRPGRDRSAARAPATCSATARCTSSRGRCWRRRPPRRHRDRHHRARRRPRSCFEGVAGHAGTVPMDAAPRRAGRRRRVDRGRRGARPRGRAAWWPRSASSSSSRARAT